MSADTSTLIRASIYLQQCLTCVCVCLHVSAHRGLGLFDVLVGNLFDFQASWSTSHPVAVAKERLHSEKSARFVARAFRAFCGRDQSGRSVYLTWQPVGGDFDG